LPGGYFEVTYPNGDIQACLVEVDMGHAHPAPVRAQGAGFRAGPRGRRVSAPPEARRVGSPAPHPVQEAPRGATPCGRPRDPERSPWWLLPGHVGSVETFRVSHHVM